MKPQTLDRHSTPAMTLKFFDVQSEENPRGLERDRPRDQYMNMHE